MHILGVLLPENQFVRYALTHFYGIGHHTAHRLCARMQIHDACKVRGLTPTQITALTAFLSAPAASPAVPRPVVAPPSFVAARPAAAEAQAKPATVDKLRGLKIETDLKREMRENIAHQRMIGSYVGRRHAMGLPVRGQNTQSNARTARKLNRVERMR